MISGNKNQGWEVFGESTIYEHVDLLLPHPNIMIVDADGQTVIVVPCFYVGLSIDKAQPIARLVAASPQLLAACEAALEFIREYGPNVLTSDGWENEAVCRQLQQAIADAKEAHQ